MLTIIGEILSHAVGIAFLLTLGVLMVVRGAVPVKI